MPFGYCALLKYWNERFMQRLESISAYKSLYVIRSVSELNRFVDDYVA